MCFKYKILQMPILAMGDEQRERTKEKTLVPVVHSWRARADEEGNSHLGELKLIKAQLAERGN